jgi:hypothetical protein
VQTKLKPSDDSQRVNLDLPADVHWVLQVRDTGPYWDGYQRHFDSLRQAAQFVMYGLGIADRANVWIATEEGNLTIEQIAKFA